MILARKLKLTVSEDQHEVLMETLDQYRKCVDRVFEFGFTNRLTNGQSLHAGTYAELRAEYPSLPSALVCVARVKATEALKAIKSQTKGKWDTEQPKSGKRPAIRYNKTCCAIGKDTLALTTTQGRIKVEHQIELCIIDTSSMVYFKAERAEKYLAIVCQLIDQKSEHLSKS